MTKTPSKLPLATQLRAMDSKNRKFYSQLDSEERRAFSSYLAMRYCANVEGITDLQEYYLLAANERVNPHYFALKAHPELQWLLCTTVSPNMGSQKHYFIKYKKNDINKGILKYLESLYPHMSDYELELMAQINSEEEIRDHARKSGWDERQIRDDL